MMASPMYLSSVPKCRNKMSVIALKYSFSRLHQFVRSQTFGERGEIANVAEHAR